MKKDAEYLKMSERLNQEKMQFRIFFPKLRKVKTLPFKGTGKHKYSFQRMEAPPLPIHFCDCEEHYEMSKTLSQDYLSSLNKVAYEKERSIMTSVMNKLFEKEENEMAASGMIKLAKKENTLGDNDVQGKETEEIQEADADNLVTNIGMGQSDDMLSRLRGKETPLVDQESRSAKLKPCKNKLMQNKTHSQKQQKAALSGTSEVVLNQESGPTVAGKTIDDEFASILPRSRLETVSEAPILNNQTEPESTVESTRINSWIQKSSWKDLVGGLGNTSFSISNVFPGISAPVMKLSNASDPATITSAASKKRKVQSEAEGSKSLEVKRNVQQKQDVAPDLGDRNKAVVEDGSREPQENGQQKQQKAALSGTSEVVLNQESGPTVAGKTIDDEFTSIVPRSKIPEGCQELETVSEAPILNNQTEPERSTVESTRSNSWIQKSSWKDLVGGLGNTSFSISNVLPGISSLETKLSNASDPATIPSAASKKRKVQSEAEGSKSLEVKRNIQQKQDVAPDLGDRNKAVVEDGSREPQENGQQQHKRIIPKINIGEVCTFMRSAESEKQWTKAKSTLSRYLKKKNNENKDSKQLKGMSTHRQ